jgi:hypothetical protein
VKSKDKAGNLSEASTPETIRTKPSAPTNPTSFNNYIIINSFNLTASVDEAVTGYNVYNGDELEYATIGAETTYNTVTSEILLLARTTLLPKQLHAGGMASVRTPVRANALQRSWLFARRKKRNGTNWRCAGATCKYGGTSKQRLAGTYIQRAVPLFCQPFIGRRYATSADNQALLLRAKCLSS